MSIAQKVNNMRNALLEEHKKNNSIDIEIKGFEVTFYRGAKPPLVYRPEPSASVYHGTKVDGDEVLVKHSMGPFGSGKSVRTMMDFLFDLPPPCVDGVIRMKTIMGRTTYRDLANTTIRTYLDWFGDSGNPAAGKLKKYVQAPLPTHHARYRIIRDGVDLGILEWEVVFLAFQTIEDIAKLKSIDATNAFLNECCELPWEVYSVSIDRTSRYPKREELVGRASIPKSLRSDTNPPTTTSWLYDIFEVQKPRGFLLFKQPPGVIKNEKGEWVQNPNADNLRNLSENYYGTMIRGKTQEAIKVFACGEYGMSFSGKAVFPEYNDDLHSVDKIEYVKGSPLYLGWDFGLTPCLLVLQFVNGQLRAIKEFVTENFGIENLIDSVVRPYFGENSLNLEGAVSKADPAGTARSTKNIFEPTLIEVIQKTFYRNTEAAQTNKQDVRLESVRKLLNRITNGKPALIISREGCPILREGFNGKYYLKEVAAPGSGQMMTLDNPVKSHPHSEPQDCLQYIAVDIASIGIKEPMTDQAKKMRDRIVGGI